MSSNLIGLVAAQRATERTEQLTEYYAVLADGSPAGAAKLSALMKQLGKNAAQVDADLKRVQEAQQYVIHASNYADADERYVKASEAVAAVNAERHAVWLALAEKHKAVSAEMEQAAADRGVRDGANGWLKALSASDPALYAVVARKPEAVAEAEREDLRAEALPTPKPSPTPTHKRKRKEKELGWTNE